MKPFKQLLCWLALAPLTMANAQLTIGECQQRARENYPLIRQCKLIEQSESYNVSNARKGYLPQLSLTGRITYQSDVTELPVRISGIEIESMRKDQYQAALELNQTLWDGGTIRTQQKNIEAGSKVEKQKIAVDLYALNDRVNQLFFGIILLDEQIKQNESLHNELIRNYRQISAYVVNGIANQADLDAVKVEQLNTLQKREELETLRTAYRKMLGIMVGDTANLQLQKPDINTLTEYLVSVNGHEIKRPELSLWKAQDYRLEVQKKQIRAKNLPKVGLFVQGAYGNPGLNMLKNEFTPYYMAGVRLSWNFGSFYTRKNENRFIETNRKSIQVQQETFLFNTNLQAIQIGNEITKLKKWMENDDEIITLRNRIRLAAEAKVANGTLTVTEMLRELTAEDMAEQNKMLHQIQLLSEIYKLKYTLGQN